MENKKSLKYENFSFEENLSKLEQIVSMMERQDVSLEEAINLYEEGLKLSIYLNNILSKYEGKIKILDKNFEEGKFSEKDFEEELKKEIELEESEIEQEGKMENNDLAKSREEDNGKVINKKSMKTKSDKENEGKETKEDSIKDEKDGKLIIKEIEDDENQQLFS
jgi:exodeoxyribonuclease VII small subunit